MPRFLNGASPGRAPTRRFTSRAMNNQLPETFTPVKVRRESVKVPAVGDVRVSLSRPRDSHDLPRQSEPEYHAARVWVCIICRRGCRFHRTSGFEQLRASPTRRSWIAPPRTNGLNRENWSVRDEKTKKLLRLRKRGQEGSQPERVGGLR
jgi:hypothetical protein